MLPFVQSPPVLTTVEVTFSTFPMNQESCMFSSVASGPTRNVTGFPGCSPKVSLDQSRENVPASSNVPSAIVAFSVQFAPRASVPLPSFLNALENGAFTAAVTPGATMTSGVEIDAPEFAAALTVAFALKSSETTLASASSVATSPAEAKTALLLSSHAKATPSTSHIAPPFVHPPPLEPPFHT